LIAHFEMLLLRRSSVISSGSRRTAIRISAPARQDRQRQSHRRADGGKASETWRLVGGSHGLSFQVTSRQAAPAHML
jgi:hypothetical protein